MSVGRIKRKHGDAMLAARRMYRLIERTIDKRGQQMLLPEYVLEGWSTTLAKASFTPGQVIVSARQFSCYCRSS